MRFIASRDAQSAICLPRFAKTVPPTFTTCPNGARSAIFAEELLAADFLQPSDWTGSIAASITAGIERVARNLGAASTEKFKLELYHTDRIGECDPFPDCEYEAKAGAAVGVFALVHDPYGPLPVIEAGRVVNHLESVLRGAGYSVFNVAARAVRRLSGWTPGTGFRYVDECWDSDLENWQFDIDKTGPPPDGVASWDDLTAPNDAQLEAITGRMAPSTYLKAYPKALMRAGINKSVMRRALATFGGAGAHDCEPEAVRVALELASCLDRYSKHDGDPWRHDLLSIYGDPVIPVSLDILPIETSPLTRAGDDYLEASRYDHDMYTEVVWFAPFDLDDSPTVRRAAIVLMQVLEIVGLLDRLLCLLDSRPRPLAEVFDDDINDNDRVNNRIRVQF